MKGHETKPAEIPELGGAPVGDQPCVLLCPADRVFPDGAFGRAGRGGDTAAVDDRPA